MAAVSGRLIELLKQCWGVRRTVALDNGIRDMATCDSHETNRTPNATRIYSLVFEHGGVDQIQSSESSNVFEGDCTTLAGPI